MGDEKKRTKRTKIQFFSFTQLKWQNLQNSWNLGTKWLFFNVTKFWFDVFPIMSPSLKIYIRLSSLNLTMISNALGSMSWMQMMLVTSAMGPVSMALNTGEWEHSAAELASTRSVKGSCPIWENCKIVLGDVQYWICVQEMWCPCLHSPLLFCWLY